MDALSKLNVAPGDYVRSIENSGVHAFTAGKVYEITWTKNGPKITTDNGACISVYSVNVSTFEKVEQPEFGDRVTWGRGVFSYIVEKIDLGFVYVDPSTGRRVDAPEVTHQVAHIAGISIDQIEIIEKWDEPDAKADDSDIEGISPPGSSDGGPTSYYDFDPGWNTFNDFMESKALSQWGAYALHLKDIGKALCRFGVKAGTTTSYDVRKIVYSGLRLLVMLEGKDAVRAELQKLSDDPQFTE